jgi:aarF domain-containing kinase
MERLRGVSLLDEETIAKAAKDSNVGTDIIITALNIWSLSVVSMPWFHADVHAGNLMLCEDGRVGFIDFGIVGRVSPKTYNAVNELSAALANGDYEGMAEALCNMGAADEEVDKVKFGRDIEKVMNRIGNMQADVTVRVANDGTAVGSLDLDETEITNVLLELVDVTEDNGLKLPREFGLLVKQSLYFDRYIKILAPNVDVMNDSRVALGGKINGSYDTKPNGVNGATEVVIDV